MQARILIEQYIAAYNALDVSAMLQVLHDEVVFENYTGGQQTVSTKGISAFEEQAKAAKPFFSERTQQIQSWEQKEQSILVHIDFKATLAKDLPNGMKAGDRMALQGSSEFEFKAGKISRIVDRT